MSLLTIVFPLDTNTNSFKNNSSYLGFMYSKSKYTLESVSVSGRPAVYTITLENMNGLSSKDYA